MIYEFVHHDGAKHEHQRIRVTRGEYKDIIYSYDVVKDNAEGGLDISVTVHENPNNINYEVSEEFSELVQQILNHILLLKETIEEANANRNNYS